MRQIDLEESIFRNYLEAVRSFDGFDPEDKQSYYIGKTTGLMEAYNTFTGKSFKVEYRKWYDKKMRQTV